MRRCSIPKHIWLSAYSCFHMASICSILRATWGTRNCYYPENKVEQTQGDDRPGYEGPRPDNRWLTDNQHVRGLRWWRWRSHGDHTLLNLDILYKHNKHKIPGRLNIATSIDAWVWFMHKYDIVGRISLTGSCTTISKYYVERERTNSKNWCVK
jgi:hypothetical protein